MAAASVAGRLAHLLWLRRFPEVQMLSDRRIDEEDDAGSLGMGCRWSRWRAQPQRAARRSVAEHVGRGDGRRPRGGCAPPPLGASSAHASVRSGRGGCFSRSRRCVVWRRRAAGRESVLFGVFGTTGCAFASCRARWLPRCFGSGPILYPPPVAWAIPPRCALSVAGTPRAPM